MSPGGIRTHNLSRRAAADLRFRPRGHWDLRLLSVEQQNTNDENYKIMIMKIMYEKSLAGFESTIPASGQPLVHALHRAAIGIGLEMVI